MADRSGADPDRRRVWQGPHPATVAARLLLLALVGGLSVYATGDPAKAFWALLLTLIGVPAVLAPQHRFLGPLSRTAEVLVTVLAADVIVGNALPGNDLFRGGGAAAAILPYLLVPVVAAALYRRRLEWVALLALAAALLLVLAFTDVPAADRGPYLVAAPTVALPAIQCSIVRMTSRFLTGMGVAPACRTRTRSGRPGWRPQWTPRRPGRPTTPATAARRPAGRSRCG